MGSTRRKVGQVSAPTGIGRRSTSITAPSGPPAPAGGNRRGKKVGAVGLSSSSRYAGGVTATPTGPRASESPESIISAVTAPAIVPVSPISSVAPIANLQTGGTASKPPKATQPVLPKY